MSAITGSLSAIYVCNEIALHNPVTLSGMQCVNRDYSMVDAFLIGSVFIKLLITSAIAKSSCSA